jgi:hypothetical protein
MFIGHFAPALLAATHKDAPSLPILFIGAQLVDWAFFGLALTGIEQMRITPGITVMNPMDLYHMPYTHSLIGSMAWALGFGIIISLWMKNRTAALLAATVVLSHWFLDVLVHAPDMTITGNPPKLGLGLWNYPAIEMPLEIGITIAALWLYARAAGGLRLPIMVLGGALLVVQAYNWFGPQPTEMTSEMPITALIAFGAFTALAAWPAKSRTLRG